MISSVQLRTPALNQTNQEKMEPFTHPEANIRTDTEDWGGGCYTVNGQAVPNVLKDHYASHLQGQAVLRC